MTAQTRRRALLPKLGLALLVPPLVIGLLEGGLRLADAGYSSRFLVADRIEGRAVYRDNLFFTYRFFDPALARSPSPCVLDRKKPPGTFRIVVLGESAAQGDPLPEFGVSRLLAPLLQSALATGRVEVVNAAITAINSHVIVEIARDLPRMQPDLVVLYVGNNEVIGPYGPGTVFTRFFDSDWLPKLAIGASRLRLYQVLRMARALAADQRHPQTFSGVEMFLHNQIHPDDPRLLPLQRRYRRNIQRLIDQAHAAGADVLLSSVAVNLGNCPPTISRLDPDMPAPDRERWQALFDEGMAARRNQDPERALRLFEEAAELAPGHAETQYALGHGLDLSGRRDEAIQAWQRARDLDGFRYRTDSALNGILRDLARRNPSAIWVDAESAFPRFPDARDADVFVDHVHFSFSGTYRLARLWAEAIFRHAPVADRFHPPPVLPTESELRERLLFTPLAELALIQPMIARFQRPPFERQLDRDARLEKLRTQAAALVLAIRTTTPDELHGRFERIFREHPGDPYWAKQWGQWLLTFQRYSEVGPALADSISRYPHLLMTRALAAQALAALNQPRAAAGMLVGPRPKQGFFIAAEIAPQLASLAADGRLSEALDFARAVERGTRRADYRHRIRQEADKVDAVLRNIAQARVLIQRGADRQAARLLAQADRSLRTPEPAYWLAGIQARSQQNPMPFLRHAFGIWSPPRSAYHAGLWRARSRVPDEARAYFDQAADGAGDDEELIRSLAWIWLAHPVEPVRDPDRAATLAPALAKGIARSPDHLRLAETLAAILAATGQWDRAQDIAAQALARADGQAAPQTIQALRDNLERISRREWAAAWPPHQMPMNFF